MFNFNVVDFNPLHSTTVCSVGVASICWNSTAIIAQRCLNSKSRTDTRCHRSPIDLYCVLPTLAAFFMPIFLGHRLVLVELMRFVQGSQPMGAGIAHARDRARPEFDGECASLAAARTEGLAAKVQGSSLRLLRMYLMYDLFLPGLCTTTFAGLTRAYASRTL